MSRWSFRRFEKTLIIFSVVRTLNNVYKPPTPVLYSFNVRRKTILIRKFIYLSYAKEKLIIKIRYFPLIYWADIKIIIQNLSESKHDEFYY